MPIAKTDKACPNLNQYQQLASGQLSEIEAESLLSHLENCDACAQKVKTLPEPDTLVGMLRQADTVGEEANKKAIAGLVERLSKLRPERVPVGTKPQTMVVEAGNAPAQIHLACSGCGKNLKVKADSAGKRVKCPLCQAVTPVPTVERLQESSRPPPPAVGEGLTTAPASEAGDRNLAATASVAGAVQSHPGSTDPHLCDFLAPAQAPDELGRLGPYRVLKVLGAGGMGVVFQAEDPHLQRLVALKAMLPGLAASESAKQRFLREARAAAALKHDHIVTIHQVGEDRGAPYLAMEFLEGESLDDRLKREGKLPLADVLRIGREMADGLAAAHERGLIHRDIKPANVWLEASLARKGGESRVKILDFGLARAATGEAHLTQPGAIVGTPAYMSPEQGQGKNVDPRSDLFSLGCVLYRMATGAAPFRGTDMISTLMAVATENPTPPVVLDPALPQELSDLVMKLLEKDVAQRLGSANEAVEILHGLEKAQGEPSPVRGRLTASSTGRSRGSARRKPVALAAAFFFAALATAAIYFLWQTPNGIVRIEVNDPDIQVVLDKDGPTIKGVGKQDIKVTPGAHGLKIKRGDLEFETANFVLRKGETITLKIEWLEEGKLQVVQAGKGVIGEMAPPIQEARKETPPTEVAKKEATPFAIAPLDATNAKEHQDGWAKHLGVPVEATNKLGMKLRLIPPGDGVAKAFYLGKYEVTQGEWQQVMGYNPSIFGPNHPKVAGLDTSKFPVDMVSWFESVVFCNMLSEREAMKPYYELTVTQRKGPFIEEAEVKILGGAGYHIPTDAEWDHGCRAGTKTKYHFGDKDEDLLEYGWSGANSDGRTHAVGEKKPNAFGLYDMHGNVREWNEDMLTNPKTGAPERIHRGGRWNNYNIGVFAVSDRSRTGPAIRNFNNSSGLRLARVAVGKESTPVVAEPLGEKEAKKLQEDWAAKLKLPVETTNKIGMKLRLIPPGVGVPKAFYLGKYEVTQGEWEQVMDYNPSVFGQRVKVVGKDTSKFPVEQVSWFDSVEYCNKLSDREGLKPYYELTVTKRSGKDGKQIDEAEVKILGGAGYRIPTDAEWEHGCRAGTKTRYHFGDKDEDLLEYAWFKDNSDGRTHAVGEKKPNAFGLYDMHGNVREWNEEMLTDAATGAPERVYRGGTWNFDARSCALSNRSRVGPGNRGNYIGLRLARVAVGKESTPSAAGPIDPKLRQAYKTLPGEWKIDGDELVQELRFAECYLIFGDFAWKDYDFTCEAKMTLPDAANREVNLLYRVTGAGGNEFAVACADKRDRVRGVEQGKGVEFKSRSHTWEPDRWYKLSVRLRGARCQCFVDDELVFEYEDSRNPQGAVGVRTASSAARFRNIRVTDPAGKVLFAGLPKLPASADQWFPATASASADEILCFKGHGAPVTDVSFSPDGRQIVSVSLGRMWDDKGPTNISSASTLRLWEAATGRELDRSLIRPSPWILLQSTPAKLAWEPTSPRFITAFEEASPPGYALGVRLWSIEGDKLKSELPFSDLFEGALSLGFTPDGHKVLAVNSGGWLREWGVEDKILARQLPATLKVAGWPVAIAPSGRFALVTQPNQPFAEIELSTGKETGRWQGIASVRSMAFSPDGARLVTGGNDGTVRIWDVTNAKSLHLVGAHPYGRVRAIAVSSDGKRALTGGDDWTVRLWDLEAKKELACFTGHTGPVNAVAFSPDGTRAVSGSADYTVRLWRLTPLPHRSGWIEEKWLREVAALPAVQQVAAVKAMMPQRNPGFEGTIKHQIVDGVVTEIQFDGSAVQDLSPLLAFAGLETLDCSCKDPWQSPLADLSPLTRLPLRSLRYPYHTWLGAEQLRSIKTLQTINDQPAAAFWTKVDGEAAEFEIFCRLVAGLTPQEQEKAVAKRFQERNPGFDGKLNAVIEKGKFVW